MSAAVNESSPEPARDPVCGMSVDPARAVAPSQHFRGYLAFALATPVCAGAPYRLIATRRSRHGPQPFSGWW
ncbi:MAG: hypothetical protein ABI627_18535 [Polyangiaceae bacterium]